MSIDLILLVVAFICFVAAALNVKVGSINLVAAGLAFWVLTAIVN
jgi:hypothetical protein